MKNNIIKKGKCFLRQLFSWACDLFLVVIFKSTKLGCLIFDEMQRLNLLRVFQVKHNGFIMLFSIPNATCLSRAKSFSSKEPETLRWIDEMESGSTLWDIGANVGIYSIYAAKSKSINVFAFEPSVFNLEQLARNINLNKLVDLVTIFQIPLSDKNGLGKFRLGASDWGGSGSVFNENFGSDGLAIKTIYEYQNYGMTANKAVEVFDIPKPDYIKMDVDGIEHLILRGADKIIKDAKSILIEINDDFIEQSDACIALLESCGMTRIEKTHSDMLRESSTFNQIWVRNPS